MTPPPQQVGSRRRVALATAGLALATWLLTGGCQTTSAPSLPLTGDVVQDGLLYIEQGPPRDRVLWQYRTALHALRRGDFGLARQLLDAAILSLGGMMQPDPSARQARSYFAEEARKTFYGEPYERVMAWYYRGLLYWMDGEPDNARACFRSAQLQDADTESHEYAADYAILDYLDGLATAKLGGDGQDAFQRAQERRPDLRLPPYETTANVLIFIDFGAGPVKYAAGEHGEQLRFRAGLSPIRSARLRWADQSLAISPVDDLLYQATTRGGRVMDHVLGNKAVFKETTDTFGNAAIIGGSVLALNRDTQEAGLAVLAAGVLSKLFAAATRPEADTRQWHNLPQYVSFALLRVEPGPHTFVVEFLDAAGQPLPQAAKTLRVVVADRPGDNVFYISDQSTASPTVP